ncbi:unnamed protein product, partial [Citrullus colocynthis]
TLGNLLFKDFKNPIDIVRLKKVAVDEEISNKISIPNWKILEEAHKLLNIARNPFAALVIEHNSGQILPVSESIKSPEAELPSEKKKKESRSNVNTRKDNEKVDLLWKEKSNGCSMNAREKNEEPPVLRKEKLDGCLISGLKPLGG